MKTSAGLPFAFGEVSGMASEGPAHDEADRDMRVTPVETGWLQRYGIAFLATAVAFFASYVTWPLMRSTPWLFCFAAIMLVAWFCGQGPSLVTTAILVVLGRYFFMKPYGAFALDRDDALPLFVFIGVSLFIGFLASAKRRAEAVERAERRWFQATVASIGDALIATDAADRVVFMNGIAEELTGWSLSEAEGRPLEEVFVIINEETRKTTPTPVKKVLETGRIQGLANHTVLLARDGSERPIDDSAAPIKNSRGETTGVVLVFRDITERKEAEKERLELIAQLESQTRVFDTALSNAADFVYTFDLEGKFTYLNHSLLALLQKHADEAVGKNFHELGYPHDLAERLLRQIQEVITSKGWVSDETPFTSALGTRHYEYIFVPVLRPNGKVEAVVGSTRDITERREAEEATRRRAEQLQKLAEIATRINSAHNVKSVVAVVTEEARTLIGARQSATGMVLTPLHPQPLHVVSTGSNQAYDRNSPDIDGVEIFDAVNVENQSIRLSQDELEHDPRWQTLGKVALAIPTSNGWLAAPLIGRNGTKLGLLQLADKEEGSFTAEDEAILVQLSRLAAIAIENAKLYDELKGNDQRKDEFLAMLAHELRNPLAAIGNAVGVTTRSGLDEDIDWSMSVITRQMNHLTRLIDDLLDVSRISRGKIELRKDVLDATSILESAADTVKPLVEERKHTFTVSIDRGNLWMNVDPTRLEQVVVNLLNNAAKYSENAGQIDLIARTDGNEVVIIVRDRGVGIPPEKLPGMFELFAQGDRSLARSEGGLGIGLTVVKKLIEMHHGSITAKSEGQGKGSEFTIRLPAAARPAFPREAQSVAAKPVAKKARILVVDDNLDTARGMERLLRLIGHEVEMAQDGHEAIRLAREFRPEFILLDIGLPGMDGYEVASRLRQDECCRGTVFLAVSGYGQEEDRRRSKEAGFDHHLIKPLDQDALLTVLSAARVSQA